MELKHSGFNYKIYRSIVINYGKIRLKGLSHKCASVHVEI